MSDECCKHGEKVDLMHHTLYGNGTPEKSLVVKVDRIDRSMKRVEKILYTIAASFGIIILGKVASWIKIEPVSTPAATKVMVHDD